MKKKMLILVTAALVTISAVALSSAERDGLKWITASQVREILTGGYGLWLIDMRSLASYDAEHIEGSVNITPLALRHKQLPAGKKIVLVDDSLGQMAARESAGMLQKNGYGNVFILEGGAVAWSLEGFPLVQSKKIARGVTASELRWALQNNIPVKVYDMRDSSLHAGGSVEGSEPVEGKNIDERIKNLEKILSPDTGRSLADRLGRPRTIVLVFSALDDPAEHMEGISRQVEGDIRYMIGGYESLADRKPVRAEDKKGCTTCSSQ